MKTKQQRIAELEAELAKLKAETERTPLGWKPRSESRFWFLTEDGFKNALNNEYAHCDAAFNRHPLYKNVQEAARADRIRKNKMEVLRCIEKHNEGWQPDWEDRLQKKIFIGFGAKAGKYFKQKSFTGQSMPTSYYMRSEHVANLVLKEMGNKILALFDMEEGEV